MAQQITRTARLEARIGTEALVIVKRAAEMEGRSLSDFVVSAAQEAARRTIEQNQLVRVSVRDQARFVDALLNPPEPAEAWERAKRAHGALIRKEQ